MCISFISKEASRGRAISSTGLNSSKLGEEPLMIFIFSRLSNKKINCVASNNINFPRNWTHVLGDTRCTGDPLEICR
jgi:hypothetical protein